MYPAVICCVWSEMFCHRMSPFCALYISVPASLCLTTSSGLPSPFMSKNSIASMWSWLSSKYLALFHTSCPCASRHRWLITTSSMPSPFTSHG